MRTLNPKLVLDPMWLCQAKYVDLEYYTYVLLDAKQKYLKNLEFDFSNFYEIIFHYLNLNTVIADKKLYNSSLESVNGDQNLLEIISTLTKKEDFGQGSQIITSASDILGQTLRVYLERQTAVLKNMHFYFNNVKLHKEGRIFIVCRSTETDMYDILKLNLESKRPLGCALAKTATVELPNLKENEFRSRLLEIKPTLTEFKPDKNVIVCTYDENVPQLDAIFLTRDLILMNRYLNSRNGFDSNAILDAYRLLEKKKSIPFKLKV
jgi:hypothetical protein